MKPPTHTISRMLRYLPRFIPFVYSKFPLARAALLLTLFATAVEYVTFSLMLPLSGAKAASAASSVVRFWEQAADRLGLSPTTQTWLWLFLLLLALRTTLAFVLTWANTLVSKQVHAHLSHRVFSQVVQYEPLSEIYRRSIGHYISVAGDDTSRAGNIVLYFSQLLAVMLDLLAGLFLLFSFSKPAFAATTAFAACSVAFVLVVMWRLMRINFATALQSRALGTEFVDAINGIRSLRSMSAESYVVSGYARDIRAYLRNLLGAEIAKQLMRTGPALLLLLIGIAWAWPGSTLTNQSRDPLYFVALTMLLVRVFVAMGGVVTKGERLISDIRAAHDIGEILPEGRSSDCPIQKSQALQVPVTNVSLHNISCRYGSGPAILTHVSGEFRRGRVYALVGESGAGKSTLADVILGLLPVSAGRMSINGLPVSGPIHDAMRGRAVLVEQHTRVFTGTIRDNVLLGHPASDAQVLAALEIAGLATFASQVPGGINHRLDYQGSNLSGGQRQRLGIARAIVRSPDLLILDEATSALDRAVRDLMLGSVTSLMKEGILILITHDPEVAGLADESWLFGGGRVMRVSK